MYLHFNRLLYIMAILSGSMAIHGQDTAMADTLSESIMITHSKVPTSQKSANQQVSIITKEDIEQSAAMDVAQLLDQQVGVQITNSLSSPVNDRTIYMQGAGGEYTLILVDGLPISDPTAIGSTYDLRSIHLADVERIEIVKGSQSVLYGNDAVAGVINIITKKSKAEEKGHIKIGLGSYKTAQINTSINIPISDQLTTIIDGSYFDTDGISAAKDLDEVGFDNDPARRLGYSARIHWRPSDKWLITPAISFSNWEGKFDGGAYLDGKNSYDNSWRRLSLTAQYTGTTSDHQLSLTNLHTHRLSSFSFGSSSFNGRSTILDYFSTLSLSDKVEILGGLSVNAVKMIDNLATKEDPSSTLLSPYATVRYQTDAFTSGQVNVDAGLRYNNHSDFGSNLNYQLGASIFFNEHIKIAAQLGTAFKAPTLFQLFGQFGANPDLSPQTSLHYSGTLGMYDLLGLDNISATYFSRSIDNVINYIGLGYINAASQDDHGIEIQVSKRYGGVYLQGGYTYLSGEQTLDATNESTSTLLRRPKHQVEVKAGYGWDTGSGLYILVNSLGSRDDVYFNSSFERVVVELEASTITHLQGVYQVPGTQLKAMIELRNLFDVDFEEIVGFSTMGRNINFALSTNF